MMATPIQPFSDIEPGKFEAITPSQFITFTMPNPFTINSRRLHFPLLRFAVCDSPVATAAAADESPVIAAMIVPKNRETDWIYNTESGHMQLLFKFPNVSRLILIGNLPPHRGPSVYKLPSATNPSEIQRLQNELKPLIIPLHPKSSSDNGSPETLFLTDEDDVAYRVTVATFIGPIAGEFVVEDIELVGYSDRNKQLRRRMRFKRMPRVVQSEAVLVPVIGYDEATTQTDLESLRRIESARFVADTRVLVHEYLIAMVGGMLCISSHLDEAIQNDFAPRALCLGIGGGVLLNFLDTVMEFEVTGVEADQTVVTAATEHFVFNEARTIRLNVGDAIEYIQNFSENEIKFDVVFVDLYSSDAEIGFCAPPPEFVTKPVFEGLKSLLHDVRGALIINVVHHNDVFYTTLVNELKEVFHTVYELEVGNKVSFVVIAIVSPPYFSSDDDNEFLKKLESVVPDTYLDTMVQL